MKFGFTGTQIGMNKKQIETFTLAIKNTPSLTEFHHGDCIGADDDSHKIVSSINPNIHIIIHPPIDPKKRAFNVGNQLLPEKPYLERNRDIVNACDMLIACPKSEQEEIRSGTWFTIRYAKKMNKAIYIIY